MFRIALLIALVLSAMALLWPGHAYASGIRTDPDRCVDGSQVECGYWWKMTAPEPEDIHPLQADPRLRRKQAQKDNEVDCTNPDEWKPPCGFVDPRHSYAFQAKQRDALMRRMVMNPNSPKAVRAFQKYNLWVFNQAITAGEMWRWNMTQDPSLNPLARSPVSRLGLNLLRKERQGVQQQIFDEIRSAGGFFVWFTRSDCSYCHGMLGVIKMLEEDSGIPVYNASLDRQCMPGFADRCKTIEDTLVPARALNIEIVPDLMLYLPEDQKWIRLATGVVPLKVIKSRARLFIGAVLAANENAVANANGYNPSVDFSHKPKVLKLMGLSEGVEEGA